MTPLESNVDDMGRSLDELVKQGQASYFSSTRIETLLIEWREEQRRQSAVIQDLAKSINWMVNICAVAAIVYVVTAISQHF